MAGDAGTFQSFQDSTGDHYVVPSVAMPYLNRQLDRSLFDVSALVRDGLTGTANTPVDLTFNTGVVGGNNDTGIDCGGDYLCDAGAGIRRADRPRHSERHRGVLRPRPTTAQGGVGPQISRDVIAGPFQNDVACENLRRMIISPPNAGCVVGWRQGWDGNVAPGWWLVSDGAIGA
ncbi:MAG TPA: hypothetical protein VH333_25035 [Pseudonocardiaceae bacterium]|nr:hypothetical protein [Pseudonocardiaceae bacterium]